MTERPLQPWERDQARIARIRELREQREGPLRRRHRFQPAVLLGWFVVVILLVAVLIGFGFVAFAPRLMSWVEDNPGSLEHGVVVTFVQWYRPEALADEPASTDRRRVTITVPDGATDTQIGEILEEAELIVSRLAFQYQVLLAGRQGTLQAGPYDLSPSMRPSEIVAALHQEQGQQVTITIREGLRLEEIVAVLADSELTMNIDQFVSLVREPPAEMIAQYAFLADLPVGRSLEGYLFPNTYEFDANWSAREVLETLLNSFDEQVTQEVRDQLAARGWTIDDAVTLASIVEREAVLEEERPLIAGVYINRLEDTSQAWVLNADPTLQYALATLQYADLPVAEWGSVDWWPPLQVGGADVELPEHLAGYQTYINAGLPPTPISAPRLSSIQAVAAPNTQDGYFYFVVAYPDGQRTGAHRFAATIEEHNANVQQALAECPPE